MKKIYKIFLLLGLLVTGLNLNAQTQGDIRINEFLVINTDNIEDDFGNKGSWIELFNSSYGTVNIGGCFLTNDPNNLTKFVIPKGDANTMVEPRQFVLFWADNKPENGNFHVNFSLDSTNEIIFVGSDGKTIIDRVKIPHDKLDTNASYGRISDGKEGWQVMSKTSPCSMNANSDLESSGVAMKEKDPSGIIMSITAMSIVFLALIALYIVFRYVGKYHKRKSQERAEVATADMEKPNSVKVEDTSAEVYAAISLAIHAYVMDNDNEEHDVENTVLTISKVARNYSPWSSKIYTLRETPNKK